MNSLKLKTFIKVKDNDPNFPEGCSGDQDDTEEGVHYDSTQKIPVSLINNMGEKAHTNPTPGNENPFYVP